MKRAIKPEGVGERDIPAKKRVILVKWGFKTQEATDIGPRQRDTQQEWQWCLPLPCLQLKPGIPLPSPEDLRGKILIKNKKNQFSELESPSKKPGGVAEDSSLSSVLVEEDTGE